MKIYMDPLPKACSECTLARQVYDNSVTPWYACFPTGRVHTSINTGRPDDCPIVGECEHDG